MTKSLVTVVCPVCDQQFVSAKRAERMGWVSSHTCLTSAERKVREKERVVRRSGELGEQVAELAREAIGPDGLMVKIPEEDAQLARAVFISRLAEAAVKLANGEKLR